MNESQIQNLQKIKKYITKLKANMSETQSNNPTLKGRLLNLERDSKNLKSTLHANENQIKNIISQIEEGTQAKVLDDKISYTKDYLTEKLERIDYKMKKHLQEQKQKNNQLLELIGIVKAEKNELQKHLSVLEDRIDGLGEKIDGEADVGTTQ